MRLLESYLDGNLTINVSSAHLDTTVKTNLNGVPYRQLPMIRIFGKAFVQIPMNLMPWRVQNLIVDLNPRSISAWFILFARRLFGKRTLVWGHLHPQSGGKSETAFLRRTMRKMANGTITYTYSNLELATREAPGQPVWVAPNSIYLEEDIHPNHSMDQSRPYLIYVGRFSPPKKVDLLVHAFALACDEIPDMKLMLVGAGSEESAIRTTVKHLGIENSVEFAGWIEHADDLRSLYGQSFASASPGFAGLGLTQSLGFGIPMVVASHEPHSPEIELACTGAVEWFESNDAIDMSQAILRLWARRRSLPDMKTSKHIREMYSAERMARGLADALTGIKGENSNG